MSAVTAKQPQQYHRVDDGSKTTRPAPVRLVGRSDVRIWSTSTSARLSKAFAKAGAGDVRALEQAPPQGSPVVLVRTDAVLDGPVIHALLQRQDIVLISDQTGAGEPLAAVVPARRVDEVATWLEQGGVGDVPAGLALVRPRELCSSYWGALRKREVPYALRATPDRLRAIEWRVFMGTYKGATDLVTKWLWPIPAFWGTKLCLRLGITPNMVTVVSLALVVLVYFLFRDGQWAAGLAAAWSMALLDTIDGKLARVTMTSSRFGHLFDHGIDLIHPPFWYVAWYLGVAAGPSGLPAAVLSWSLGIIIAGYVALRLIEGVFKAFYGMHIHVWRRFDTWFRLVVSRRNPNLILFTVSALIGRPDLGLLAVATWTVISVLVHLVQLGQASFSARRDGSPRSWLAEDQAA